MARYAPHREVARCSSVTPMRGQIVKSGIGFRLYDSPRYAPDAGFITYKTRPKQFPRHKERWALIKCPCKNCHPNIAFSYATGSLSYPQYQGAAAKESPRVQSAFPARQATCFA